MEIIYIGNYRNQNQELRGSVYGWGGCCPVIRSNDYKEPIAIVEVFDGTRESNRIDKEIWQQE